MPKSKKPTSERKAPAAGTAKSVPALLGLADFLAMAGNGEETFGGSDLERAQEIAFDAMEADDRETSIALAHEALAISPLCADAHLILARETDDIEESITLCRQAVEAGERALGKEFFSEAAGHFWGFIETRPYMRARQELAMLLWEVGEHGEAIRHYQDMLRLNPNDNQGIRYLLANALLELGRDAQVGRLLKDYAEDDSAAWAWSAALLAFRRAGKGADSLKALQRAVKANKHVPDYLIGTIRMPEELPGLYRLGDRSEAIAYVDGADAAWMASEGAKAWLAASLERGRLPDPDPDEEADADPDAVDEAVLALLLLGLHDGARVWKSFDWEAMDRLHQKGLISNPASKAKSVVLSEEGFNAAKAAHQRLFGKRR